MEECGTTISDDGSASSSSSDRRRHRSTASTNQGSYRSVVDYDTEEQLFEALMLFLNDDVEHNQSCSAQMTSLLTDIRGGEPVQKVAGTAEFQTELAKGMDWVLPAFDAETSHPQSVEAELKRLQVLKSYMVLDAKSEDAFERITNLAARIFDAPFSIVSLVDLGRNFFMSNFGFKTMDPDARDIPRKFAFCTQTLQNKEDILVVPDATQDFRFADNPFVTSPPFVKFYAGAPLITPEGYKLGTICILDAVARPHGLSPEQLNTLRDLADMTVKVMVDRRYQLNKKKSEGDPAQNFTYTAHDLVAPLIGIHASLSVLKNDSVVKAVLGEHQFELLCTAATCSELMTRICKDAIDGLNPSDSKSLTLQTDSSLADEVSNSRIPLTNVKELVKSLQMIAEPIAKVPCIVTLDKALPSKIVGDDLKLFRSTVNLLTNAIERTSTGMIHLSIRLEDTVVLFECEDTGDDIPIDEYQFLFQQGRGGAVSARLGLASLAKQIESLDGEYGFRPRDGYVITKSSGRRRSGSIFWFSVPLILPEKLDKSLHGTISTSLIEGRIEPVGIAPRLGADVLSNSFTTTHSDGLSFTKSVDREAQMTQAEGSMYKGRILSGDLAKLASDLDLPLADLEPVPLNGLMAGIVSNDVRRRRALIIDDSVVVRRSLVHTLNSLGFDVVQADDGEEGFEKLRQYLFDLVLCEFSMPVMDGITCVTLYRAWEKENRPWDRQLIVGISADPRVNDNDQGLQAGMNAFFPKPLTIKTITKLQCCSEAVQRTRQLDTYERKGRTASATVDEPTNSKFPGSDSNLQSSSL